MACASVVDHAVGAEVETVHAALELDFLLRMLETTDFFGAGGRARQVGQDGKAAGKSVHSQAVQGFVHRTGEFVPGTEGGETGLAVDMSAGQGKGQVFPVVVLAEADAALEDCTIGHFNYLVLRLFLIMPTSLKGQISAFA